jgi:Armadillo/beta-catenin-like repeat
MAKEGGIEMLIYLLESDNELILRQSAKALANLGVNANNKRDIALKGGIPKLARVAGVPQVTVKIEAVAALANLAVNGKHVHMLLQYSSYNQYAIMYCI